jgi:Mg2+ and Co2+ transporter CorA
MNIILPLQEESYSFEIIILIMLTIGGGMIAYFRRKKWM